MELVANRDLERERRGHAWIVVQQPRELAAFVEDIPREPRWVVRKNDLVRCRVSADDDRDRRALEVENAVDEAVASWNGAGRARPEKLDRKNE